ncbi:MAG: hypothetical protein ACPG41_04325, partial [Lacinutrix venerupis]
STQNTNEVYTALKGIEDLRQTMADATKQLAESKKTAEKFKKNLSSLNKKKYKEEIKASKEIIKKIDEQFAVYFGKEDDRQGITRSNLPTVNSRIGNASSYISSRQNGLTSTETTLLNHAKTALKEALKETNTFFNTDWKNYRNTIENLDISEFKAIENFSID